MYVVLKVRVSVWHNNLSAVYIERIELPYIFLSATRYLYLSASVSSLLSNTFLLHLDPI